MCFFGKRALYAQGRMAPGGSDGAMVILAGVNLMVFAAGHGAMAVLSFRALAAVSIRRKAATLASLPFYWLLMSIAAWLALWQFVAAPFHWNKTEHGLSRRSAQKRPSGESLAWRFTSL